MSSRHATADHPAQPALDAELASLGRTESEALRWLVRRQDGLSADDERSFQTWLQADTSHQHAFDDASAVWLDLDAMPADDVARLRNTVSNTPTLAGAPPQPTRPSPVQATARRTPWASWLPRHTPPRPWGSHAVTFCATWLLLGLGWFAWHLWQQPTFSQQYATARGQQLDIGLPDGSTLKLDTASRADATLYRQRREVRLAEGQVLFHVHGNQAQPFDVLAGGTRITVVGTRFSVRYTPSLGDAQVQVAVEEGRVRVTRADDGPGKTEGKDVVELTAGQTVAAAADGHLGAVGHLGDDGIAPWQNRRLSFYDTTLSSALAELERYGPTGLVIRDPAVAALRVTGTVDLNRVHDFTRSLPRVLPIRLEARGSTTEVLAKAP